MDFIKFYWIVWIGPIEFILDKMFMYVSAIQLPSAEQEKPVLASKQIFRSECLR